MAATDTIFAPATGAGRAAIAVVRISGPATRDVLGTVAGRVPSPRVATLATLRHAEDALDRALVLWFPGPGSFTGEDAAELQLHGGRAVVAAVLKALAAVPGCRPAEPGEFTRRALLNGKMDIGAVEGLADLIDAQTEAQRRQALRHLDGALGRWTETLRDDLLSALALAEGAIDFAEDDDLVASFEAEIDRLVGGVSRVVAAELGREARGLRLREGLAVAIVGPPNAGKSTLLNALAGRDVAIVSAQAGTTRDVLTVDLDLGGYPVQLIDTAGLRETEDDVEREGIARARARAASADLVLLLDDGRADPLPPAVTTSGTVWRIATKVDLAAGQGGDYAVSARTGTGLDGLIAGLSRFAAETLLPGEGAMVTRLRHRAALEAAQACLLRIAPAGQGRDLELVAEDLRGAVAALAGLVGRIDTEAVLGAIFARFCIGK
ncbi:tRNA uridine-5-carboxymethylaminomethyl(34) synthesis GTPase MnmE [Lichenibacterium ramalinae]|uniref:tRNA modification GTPase MnmE n=1 Tax=Lichenibacterium ramalinae TaxID=2316527 RepID=A0A4Q2RBK0_9HYPH|nr:tRNA uridine-5-carboxymethylaminomethyl(34) synthesis GTPase MnmE [Lichenibacterium ramalinae]RYB03899.1 tRNA uridine-5-carboxymethylaminomethyl(34) synthesis GTPase MnmE [Lichenibacterium ramalinae]